MTEGFYKLPANLEQDIAAHEQDVNRFLADELSASILKARRVPRGIYEQRQDGAFMVRVRVAGGTLSGEQMRVLAHVGRTYGKGTLHVTSRQDVQLHDVAIADTPKIMRELFAVGLTSKGGGGNTVRNVTACPYAGICPAEVFDVTPFAHAVTEYLIALEGSYNLPRKYKIAFSGCGADCALTGVNDLGFVAQARDGAPGFSVYAGGGMGAQSRVADPLNEWVPTADVVQIAETVRRLFDRMGDRHNRQRARLRFVFEKIGPEAFRDEFNKQLTELREEGVPACDVEVTPLQHADAPAGGAEAFIRTQDGIRAFAQRQEGYIAVHLHLPSGDISCDDFEALSHITERLSEEKGLRAAQSQNLILRFVREGDVSSLAEALRELTIDVLSPSPLERFVTCTGAATCRLGLCLSRGAAGACAEALEKDGVDMDTLRDVDVRISGCPNACGQHPIGTIGLFGTAQRSENRLVPSYKVLLGARRGEGRTRLGGQVGAVPARGLPACLLDLMRDYQDGRRSGESFADYYDRQGGAHFENLVAQHARIPSYTDDPTFYRDWGRDEDFSLAGRGAGECGAGVFELIMEDVAAAKRALAKLPQAADGQATLFDAALCTIRALCITRGVDTRKPDDLIHAFETHFVDTGLVDARFRDLLSRARGYVHGWKDAFEGKEPEIGQLLARVELLFSTLDSKLEFHPPEQREPTENRSHNPTPSAPGASGENTDSVSTSEDTATEELDLRGVACPMNFVKAKLKLEMMQDGETLSVILDDGEPVQNVPPSFRHEGQDVLEMVDLEDGHWRVVVRKNR